MLHKIVYVVFVDCNRQGTYMNHVNGFISGLKSLNIPLNVHGVGLHLKDNQRKASILGYLPKVFAYLLLDILVGIRILCASRDNIFIVRPYRYTIAVYLAAAVRRICLIQENNGLLVDELRSNGHRIQSKLYYLLESVFLNVPNLHLCVSSGITDYFISRNTRGEVFTVSNGIDLSKRFRKFKNSYEDGLHLLFIGKLTPWQGLSEFLEYLKANPSDCILSLSIIGDGVERKKIERLAAELSIDIKFNGWCAWDDIYRISEKCNVGIVPRVDTNVSGSPLKLLDYIALGMPVLSTESDGVSDVLGTSSLLFPFNYSDPNSLKFTYENLREINQDILAKEADYILKKYSWENHVRVVIDKIKELN